MTQYCFRSVESRILVSARFLACNVRPRRDRQRGVVLVAVLLLAMISLVIAYLAANASRTELKIAHNLMVDMRALAVAEAGLLQARTLIAARDKLDDELAP